MTDRFDVAVVGGGVSGLSASIFTARGGLDTVVLSGGRSLVERNAHLENYPGFPAGVNSRLLVEMMREQSERNGAEIRSATVTHLERGTDGFAIETDSGRLSAKYVIAATKDVVEYLRDLGGIEIVERGTTTFVETDERGRTGVEGLYAAGRLAAKPHQTVIAAGHGAEVAVTLLEEHPRGFYHDWVAPKGYFTGRGIAVPPGVEEIDDAERLERERESIEVMREHFAGLHPGEPEQHPQLTE